MNNTNISEFKKQGRFFLLAFYALIQFTYSFAQQGNFRNYTVADGLPQSNIYAMFNDSRGYMWIGSEKGVCSFDGLHYINYDRKNGINGTTIRAIDEDDYGRLWFGHENGLSIFNGRKFAHIDSSKGIKAPVMAIYNTGENTFWIGTSGSGAFIIKNHENPDSIKIEKVVLPETLGSSHIFAISSDKKGSMFLGSFAAGIYVLNATDKKIIKILQTPQIPSNHILSLEFTEDGSLWAGSYGKGAFKLNSALQTAELPKTIENDIIWDIYSTPQELWYATDQNGIWRKKSNTWMHFDQTSGLLANQIFKISRDSEGNIWLAVYGNGLSMFLGDHFEHFGTENKISNRIYGVQADAQGQIWLATDDQGLVCFRANEKEKEIIKIKNRILPEENSITCISIDKQGNIWTDHANKGVSKYDGQKFSYYTTFDGLINNEVNCIFPDSKGRVWIGTIGGISILDKEKFFNIDSKTYGLPNDAIQTIAESDGDIWVGTMDGLLKFSGNQMTTFDEEDGLSDKQVSSLAIGMNNSVWIGTTGGLYCLNKDNKVPQIKKVADDEILQSTNITGLLLYKENQLIVATDKGFDFLFLSKGDVIQRIRHYDKMNGFLGVENKNRAITSDKYGNIWFGTVKGLTKYNPKLEKENSQTPKLMITAVKLFYQNIDNSSAKQNTHWLEIPRHLALKYSENHISFQFIGISYTDPTKVRYRYMLEGLEKDWSPPRNVDEAVYSGLKPGKYVFRVISKGANGIWQKEPVSYAFEISPPFWQKVWFIILVTIIAILIIFSYMRYRERKLRKDKLILEQTVVERTAEIMQQKEVIENKNHILTEQKKEITDSINYAKQIQMALLPSGNNLKDVFAEHFVIYMPRDTVSGDFYWHIEKDKKILLVVADCTGHGVPGAFMSMLGFSYLNQLVTSPVDANPAEILNELRCKIIAALKHGGTGRQDGMDMAVVYYNAENDFLTYAGANIPLIKISTGPTQLSIVKPDKMPVGEYVKTDLFKNNIVPVRKEDMLYLSSDGYEDQFGGPMNKKFMSGKMKAMFEQHHMKSLEEQRQIYSKTIIDWMAEGNVSQTDDITLFGFKIL